MNVVDVQRAMEAVEPAELRAPAISRRAFVGVAAFFDVGLAGALVDEGTPRWQLVTLATLAALVTFGALHVWRLRVTIAPRGLQVRSLGRGTGLVPWHSLTSVRVRVRPARSGTLLHLSWQMGARTRRTVLRSDVVELPPLLRALALLVVAAPELADAETARELGSTE